MFNVMTSGVPDMAPSFRGLNWLFSRLAACLGFSLATQTASAQPLPTCRTRECLMHDCRS
jgi:hypothetical protein